jgi:hypothetical protein
MKRLAVLLLVGLIAPPVLAQQSPSFKLKESVFNAGGHPKDGTILTSTSFRVKLDALGEGIVKSGLASASFHMDASFLGAYPPAGEIRGLRFIDRNTMNWDEERSIGSYNLYRDLVNNLSLLDYGYCLQYGLANATAADTDPVPLANGFFYLVTAKNRLLEEGSKGNNSSGAERGNTSPCP